MKVEVLFREYDLPYIDECTGEEERGDFLGSFKKNIEGKNMEEIINKASEFAEELSKEWDEDVRVFEIPLPIGPNFGR